MKWRGIERLEKTKWKVPFIKMVAETLLKEKNLLLEFICRALV